MYRIKVSTSFRASHQLNISGQQETRHEHNWLVEASVGGKNLDDNGLLMDFYKLKTMVDKIVVEFNDRKLEDCPPFWAITTTAEIVAKYIYNSLKPLLPANIELFYVQVQESPGCWARYES